MAPPSPTAPLSSPSVALFPPSPSRHPPSPGSHAVHVSFLADGSASTLGDGESIRIAKAFAARAGVSAEKVQVFVAEAHDPDDSERALVLVTIGVGSSTQGEGVRRTLAPDVASADALSQMLQTADEPSSLAVLSTPTMQSVDVEQGDTAPSAPPTPPLLHTGDRAAFTAEKFVAVSSWLFVLLALALGIWLGNNKTYLLSKCGRGPRKTCDFDRATSTLPTLVHKPSGSDGGSSGKLVPEPTV